MNIDKTQDNTDLLDTEEILERMLKERQEKPSLAKAKQEDRIAKFDAAINTLKSKQYKQNELITTCNTIIDSKAFPALNPLVAAFAERLSKSNKKMDKKIKSNRKKTKKAKNKIKKLVEKQKRTSLMQAFVDTMLDPHSGKEEYIQGMMALRDDSLIRTQAKLDRTTAKINNMVKKLRSGNLNKTQIIKITDRLREMQSKREKLEDKLNSLNGMGDQLQKLANYNIVAEKVEMLKNTAVETAEKAAMSDSSLSSMIDTQTEASVEVVEKALHPDMSNKQENTEAIESPVQEESQKKTDISQQENNKAAAQESFVKISNIDENGINRLFRAGIDFQTVTAKDGSRNVVFKSADLPKVKAVLNSEQEKQQSKGMKRE